MFFLAELWFLVSTAILHFANWRCRKKKSPRLSIHHHQSYSSWFVISLRLATLFLVLQSCFSTFSSFNTNSSSITEAELGPAILYPHSPISLKTFHQQTFDSPPKKSIFSHFLFMVSTETEFSNTSSIRGKKIDTDSDSSEFTLHFTWSWLSPKLLFQKWLAFPTRASRIQIVLVLTRNHEFVKFARLFPLLVVVLRFLVIFFLK